MFKSFAKPVNRALIQLAARRVTTLHRAQGTPKGTQDAAKNAHKLLVCHYATDTTGTKSTTSTTPKPVKAADDSIIDDFFWDTAPISPPPPNSKPDGTHSTADDFTHSKTSDGITNSMNRFADVVAAAAKLSAPAIDKNSGKK